MSKVTYKIDIRVSQVTSRRFKEIKSTNTTNEINSNEEIQTLEPDSKPRCNPPQKAACQLCVKLWTLNNEWLVSQSSILYLNVYRHD